MCLAPLFLKWAQISMNRRGHIDISCMEATVPKQVLHIKINIPAEAKHAYAN